MDETAAQIAQLKELTRTTGALHDAQVFQLKMLPLVVLEADNAKITFKCDKENTTFKVTYSVVFTKKRPTKFQARLVNLCKFTQDLLGEEYTVTVKCKGKTLFNLKGDPNAQKAWSTQRRESLARNPVDDKGKPSPSEMEE